MSNVEALLVGTKISNDAIWANKQRSTWNPRPSHMLSHTPSASSLPHFDIYLALHLASLFGPHAHASSEGTVLVALSPIQCTHPIAYLPRPANKIDRSYLVCGIVAVLVDDLVNLFFSFSCCCALDNQAAHNAALREFSELFIGIIVGGCGAVRMFVNSVILRWIHRLRADRMTFAG